MRRSTLISFLIFLLAAQGCKKDHSIDQKITSHDFLSSGNYDKLIVEFQYVSGHKPTAAAINNLQQFLEQRLHKSGGISMMQHEIPSPNKSSLSLDDIKNIEQTNRTQHTSGNTLTAYFLFADAAYSANSGNAKVLGIAYGNTSMVIFEKTIREYAGGIAQPSVSSLEKTVVQHEFGQILGLVNNGTALQSSHQDISYGKHCDNQNCLMYYTAETSDIVGNLLGGNTPQLDITLTT